MPETVIETDASSEEEERIRREITQYVMSNRKRGRQSPIAELEGPNGLSLLLYLDCHPVVIKTDIYRNISKSASMKGRLDKLSEAGVISIRYAGYVNAYGVMLTPKGKAIVRRIRDMMSCLE